MKSSSLKQTLTLWNRFTTTRAIANQWLTEEAWILTMRTVSYNSIFCTFLLSTSFASLDIATLLLMIGVSENIFINFASLKPLCLWDSRATHNFKIKEWPQFILGLCYLHYISSLYSWKILGNAFKYLKQIFTKLNDDRFKEGIFVKTQIWKILKDPNHCISI